MKNNYLHSRKSPGNGLNKGRALIVEDDPVYARTASERLVRLGLTPFIAVHDEAALKKYVYEDQIDLILLDLDPGLDDHIAGLLRLISSQERIPILFLISPADTVLPSGIGKIRHYGFIPKDAPAPVFESSVKTSLRLARTIRRQFFNRHLELALDASGDGVWDWDVSTGSIYSYTPSYNRMLGYVKKELPHSLDDWLSIIHPDDRAQTLQRTEECIQNNCDQFSTEFRVKTHSGDWIWVLGRGKSIVRDKEGHSLRIIGTHVDITKMYQEDLLTKSLLAERELLLKEQHHRMKNNMGAIQSLLSFKGEQLQDPAARAVIRDAEYLFQGMALLSDKLYHTSDYCKIPVSEFLPELVDLAVAGHPVSCKLRVNKHIGVFSIDQRKITVLGIALNELICNALKYAFSGRNEGILEITAHKTGDNAVFTVSDDGAGISGRAEGRNSGLALVEALVSQIKGTIAFSGGHQGTKIQLEFPLD